MAKSREMVAIKVERSLSKNTWVDGNVSAAPVGLIELLTYRLHRMPIGVGKL